MPLEIKTVPKKTASTEHYSFWLRPETMRYIRQVNRLTRIPQGQILQIVLDYFRLTRTKAERELTDEERKRINYVEFIMRIMPL